MQPLALVDLALPIQWQMIAILRHEDVREKSRTRQAACDRPAGICGLHDALTTDTGELRAHVADDLVALRNVLNHLADIFAQRPQRTATGRAAARGCMQDLLARQMLWQCETRRLLRRRLRRRPRRSGIVAR